jgi:hypothetical protein
MTLLGAASGNGEVVIIGAGWFTARGRRLSSPPGKAARGRGRAGRTATIRSRPPEHGEGDHRRAMLLPVCVVPTNSLSG